MKKIKLLLAAMAAMVGLSAQAQSWTAPTIQGEDPVSGSAYTIYNVGAGQFLAGGQAWYDWNTSAVVTNASSAVKFTLTNSNSGWTLKRPDGRVVFISGAYNGKGEMHVDGVENSRPNRFFEFIKQGNGSYRIRAVSSDATYGSVMEGYESKFWGQSSTDPNSAVGVYATVNPDDGYNCDWEFIGESSTALYNARVALYNEYLKATAEGVSTDAAAEVYNNASATVAELNAAKTALAQTRRDYLISIAENDNPQDLTEFYVVNPDFSTLDATGWTRTQTSVGNQQFGRGAMESWNNNNVSVTQDLTNLPNGRFRVSCDMISGNTGRTAYVYAKGMTEVNGENVSAQSSKGDYTTMSNEVAGKTVSAYPVIVGDHTMTIGFKDPSGWVVVDNFKVIYYGPDLTAFKDALQSLIDGVADLEGTTTTAAYNAVKAYADEIDVSSLNTEEAIATASTELNALIDAAKALQSAYAGYLTVRGAVDALDDDATVYSGDATLNLTAIDATVNATTTLDALNAAIETAKPQLQAAAAEFISSVTLNEGKRFDITNIYLTNPDFEIPTANEVLPPGWTITITGQNCGQRNRTDTNPDTGLAITNFIEAWHPSQLGNGVIAQTVSSLPEGTYVLECDASICHDPAGADDITGANLFVQSSLKKKAEAISNVRLYINHYTVSFSHGGSGSVTFGLEANNTNANWLSADNFKVYYAGGVDLSVYEEALAEAVAAFKALEASADAADYATYKAIVDENNIKWSTSAEYQAAIDAVKGASSDLSALIAAKAAFNAAVAAANEAKAANANANVTGSELTALDAAIAATPGTTAEYTAATETLTAATTTFTAAATSYDAYVAAKAKTTTLFGEEVANSVDAPTTAAAAAAAVNELNIAQYNKVASDYTYSLSGLIGDFGSWTGTATVAGTKAEPNYLDYEHWSGNIHAYYEQASTGWGNANGWTIKYEKTCTLPAGDYVIKVAARSSAGTTSLVSCTATDATVTLPNLGAATRGINTDGEASWSDDDTFAIGNNNNTTPAVGGQGLGWQWRFLPFTLSEQTEVTMTFYAEATTQYQWMSIADGELLSANDVATAVTYDEGDDNTIEDVLVANVTMNRTIKTGYNTVVLPFTLTANQVTAAFGAGTEVYNFSENSTDANDITINFNKGDGSITANVPVLVKATTASNKQTFNGVKVVAPTQGAAVQGTNANFIGVFGPTTVAAGDYFIGNGAVYKSQGQTNIKAFRAYIDVDNTENVKMFIDGITTAISEINGAAAENGAIYNLAGQRVNKAQKGVFIVNGKKVIVK